MMTDASTSFSGSQEFPENRVDARVNHRGWICVHRQILSHPRANNPDWLALWLTLLLLANYRDNHSLIFNGKQIFLQPGQLITGRKSLAQRVGISPSKIERLLTMMKSEHQIEQQTSSTSRLITILNWKQFQISDSQSNNDRTTTGHIQQSEQSLTTKSGERDKADCSKSVEATSAVGAVAQKKNPDDMSRLL